MGSGKTHDWNHWQFNSVLEVKRSQRHGGLVCRQALTYTSSCPGKVIWPFLSATARLWSLSVSEAGEHGLSGYFSSCGCWDGMTLSCSYPLWWSKLRDAKQTNRNAVHRWWDLNISEEGLGRAPHILPTCLPCRQMTDDLWPSVRASSGSKHSGQTSGHSSRLSQLNKTSPVSWQSLGPSFTTTELKEDCISCTQWRTLPQDSWH